MRLMLLLQLFALTACGEPATIFKPVTLEIPVTVPCKAATPLAPASPLQQMPNTASIFDKTKAALAELDQRRAYEAELTAALRSCQ